MAVCLSAAPAGAQVTRVSLASDGTQANGPSKEVVISRDGKILAFSSDASNLVTGDTNGVRDVFVRDIAGTTTTRVSVASDGTERPGASGAPDYTRGGVLLPGTDALAISDDGNLVAFASSAAFDAADVYACTEAGNVAACVDIYVHDRTSGQTTRVSVASDGTQGNGHSTHPRLSGDGRYVVFESTASNLVTGDTNGESDVFLHDRTTHATTRVSLGPHGEQLTFASTAPAISANGAVVAMVTTITTFAAPPFSLTCSPELLLPFNDPCTRALVRTLASGEAQVLPLGPAFRSKAPYLQASRVALSANGRIVIVRLGQASFEFHDLDTGTIRHSAIYAGQDSLGMTATDDGRSVAEASRRTPSGQYLPAPGSTLAVFDRFTDLPENLSATGWNASPSLSGSGRFLAFSADDASLVAGDTNGAADIFIQDRDPDQDGQPTVWETFYGLNPNVSDGALDSDDDGQTNLQEYQASTHPKGTQTRYFAEGAYNDFFVTRLALLNPNATPAAVTVRLLGENGQQASLVVSIPAHARRTVSPSLYAGTAPDWVFSTIVESDQPIVSDRLMTWDRSGYGNGYGSSLETSVAAPGTTWYLAEGATGSTYSLYYLLQNPGDTDTEATVTYLLPTPQAPIVKTYPVAAHTRVTIDVRGEAPALAHAEVSAKITSVQPLVVERSLYMSTPTQPFAAGHDGAGIAAPATRWFLAEGATGFFDEYVLIANADASAAQIKVTYLLEAGQSFSESFQVAGNSRYTVDVKSRDPRLLSTPVSVIVESTNSVPVVVERAMWWPHGNWYEASLSAGVTGAGTKWAFAEGQEYSYADRRIPGMSVKIQTYVLIANTDPTHSGTATITLLRESGAPLTATVPILANERTTVDIGAKFPDAANAFLFGIIVESDGVPIVAERAIYSSIDGVTYGAGATSVGTNLAPVP
jgi:Tol biopolymer transport system component